MGVTCQALLAMKFSRQEYWSGLPFPSPGDLLDPGIKPGSPALQADSLLSEPPGNPRILEWVAYPSSGIFPTQELNQGLLYCRQILYQLSYQRTPDASRCGSNIQGPNAYSSAQALHLQWLSEIKTEGLTSVPGVFSFATKSCPQNSLRPYSVIYCGLSLFGLSAQDWQMLLFIQF